MIFKKPAANANFTVSSAAVWPSIVFETDGTGNHTWSWTIKWGSFTKSGTTITAGNTWDAKGTITDLGGKLTVTAKAGTAPPAVISVNIKGTNPTSAEVDTYLATQANSTGFGKIISHETKYKHFNASNEPIKSFDNGYGMCQLTSPAPTFEQAWNWKLNVDGGLKLFASKRTSAITYLGQSKRSYTTDQLKYETVCRWNGGAYHVWDATKGWVRDANMLCDTQTGNIGWDMTKAENKGKTEADLRKRDMKEYSSRPKDAKWKYSGVCYADKVLS